MCPNSGRKLSKLLNDSEREREREREYAHDYMVFTTNPNVHPYTVPLLHCQLLATTE